MLYGRFTFNLNMIIVLNSKRESDSDPDYLILVNETQEKDSKKNGSAAQQKESPSRTPKRATAGGGYKPSWQPGRKPAGSVNRFGHVQVSIFPGTLPDPGIDWRLELI